MRTILFFAFALLIFTGCKKDKEQPAPELSTRVAGTYKAIKLTYGGIDIPLTASNSEMLLVVDKSGSDAITGKMKLKLEGETAPDETFGPLSLKDSGDGGVDIFEGSLKVGNVSKSNLMNITAEDDGVEINVIAQRQ